MERNDKLKEIDIKNPTCYYFGEKIKIEDFDFDIFFFWLKIIGKYFDLWHSMQNFDWYKTIG